VIEARSYAAKDQLKDGTSVTVRAIRVDDKGAILSAFDHLDRESIYTRFFTFKKSLSEADLRQITDVDFDRVVALVVELGPADDEKLIGGGRYFCDDRSGGPRTAELAFVTDSEHRGLGIASLLLKHLTRIGRASGVERFEALVLPRNRAMLTVFNRSGLKTDVRREGDLVHVTLFLDTGR
jgi:RimJ/RimL family protein N-acetyltransferase